MTTVNELKEYLERIKDRTFQTRYSLWNALIVLNGLMISSITILFSLYPNTSAVLVLTLFLLSIISITLLVWNYIEYDTGLENVAKMIIKISQTEDTEEKNKQLKETEGKAISIRKKTNCRQNISIAIILLNILITAFSIASYMKLS